MGQRTVIVPGSSTWVQCRHGPIYGAATGDTLGVADIGAGTGETSGTAGVCGFEVTGITGATGRGCSNAVVQAWQVQALSQKCKVWQEPAVWLM